MTNDELFNAIEMDPSDSHFRSSAKLLMSALTDWPTSIQPNELIEELKREIKCKLTFDNIKEYRKGLKPSSDAWKMEALSSVLQMYDFEQKEIFDRTIELDTIIGHLSQHYKATFQ